MKSLVSASVAALVLSGGALAVGNAIINNECDYDAYVAHVSENNARDPVLIKSGTGTYKEKLKSCSFGGVSLKLSRDEDRNSITQLEYTLTPDMTFYDISNFNCKTGICPFQNGGMSLHLSTDNDGVANCVPVFCPAGPGRCPGVYWLFNDDWASHGCSDTDADLIMTLCPGKKASTESSAESKSYGSSTQHSPPATTSKTSTHANDASVKAASVVEPVKASNDPPESLTTPAAELSGDTQVEWVTEIQYATAFETIVVTARDTSIEDTYRKHKARNATPRRHLRHARRHHPQHRS